MALPSHLVHHSSFWAWKKMKHCFAPNGLKTYYNVQNGSLKPFGASQLILSLNKNEKLFRSESAQILLKRSERSLKPFGASQLWNWKKIKNCFAPNGFKTCLNVQNGSQKPFSAPQLILSLKKNEKLFRSEWAQNLLQRSEWLSQAIWCITAHFELEQKWKIVSLRMGSKLAKTFRMALSSHLVHHSSYWAWKKMKNYFAPNGLKTC